VTTLMPAFIATLVFTLMAALVSMFSFLLAMTFMFVASTSGFVGAGTA